jgi:DNA-binding response OmpR family regulator
MKSNHTILVVDDNELNLDILVSILHMYDVIPTINGITALEIVESEDIDLILLDVMMPEIDGFDVCRRLKSNDKTKHIPVIFITAKHGVDDMQKGFDVGAVDYVAKPFNTLELLSRVNTHLQLKSYQENLEKKVKYEIEKNKLQEQIIFQNSKQAEIGELLMHIAHQWKQPLSELGSVNLLNTLLLSHDKMNKEELDINFNRISMILEFMSKTVETFQNFYKPNLENSFFDIYSTVEKAINIISATFDYENIQMNINKKINPKVCANQNEYAQVVLSILNNAKDAFLRRKIKDKIITLTITGKDDKSIVTIEDTAGGVELEELEDIFLPLVSEKGSMGIGLYMSKNIMTKNGGTLEIENTKRGAKFTITL